LIAGTTVVSLAAANLAPNRSVEIVRRDAALKTLCMSEISKISLVKNIFRG
jgi:hypothetical protein